MKSMILVALALVAVAVAAPVDEPSKIISYNFEQQPNGAYVFSFEGEDGSKREEEGVLKEALDEENKVHNVIVVRGYSSYLGDDGKPVVTNYSADELGYKAEGDAIPKAARR